MHAAPPSPSGPRIDEQGGTLVVTFRPRRSGILFLGFWLVFWTFAGIGAMTELAHGSWDTRGFFLTWLCGWAAGEAVVASLIAWKIAGRELLTVTANELEVRKQLGRHSVPTGRVHVLAIEDVRAERVPAGEDERPRRDFRLRILSQGRPDFVAGEGMDERTAERVASVVRSRVHPQRQWEDDDATEYGFARPADPEPAIPEPAPAGRPWVGGVVILLIFAGAVAVNVVPRLHHHHARPAPALASGGAPPRRETFADPHAYAIAMTRWVLGEGDRSAVESEPSCITTDGWRHWTCRARARSRYGPLAGRSLVYSCTAVDEHQQVPPVSPPALEVACNPDPPITP